MYVVRSLVIAVLIVVAAAGPAQAAGRAPARAARGQVTIDVLSNRADLVSGGDALVQSSVPPTRRRRRSRPTSTGRDVTSAFADNGGGRLVGLVKGLAVGPNRDGHAARRARSAHHDHQPSDRGPGLLGAAGPAVGLQHAEPAGEQRRLADRGARRARAAPRTRSATRRRRSATSTRTRRRAVRDLRPRRARRTRRRSRRRRPTRARRSRTSSARSTASRTAASTRSRCSTRHGRAGTTSSLTHFGPNTAPRPQQSQPPPVLDDRRSSRGFMVGQQRPADQRREHATRTSRPRR